MLAWWSANSQYKKVQNSQHCMIRMIQFQNKQEYFLFLFTFQITNLSRTAFKIIWKQKQTEFARTNSVKWSPGVLQMLQFWQMMIRPLAVKVPINIILHMHQQQKLIRSISKQICMICMHSYHHLLRLQSFSLRA